MRAYSAMPLCSGSASKLPMHPLSLGARRDERVCQVINKGLKLFINLKGEWVSEMKYALLVIWKQGCNRRALRSEGAIQCIESSETVLWATDERLIRINLFHLVGSWIGRSERHSWTQIEPGEWGHWQRGPRKREPKVINYIGWLVADWSIVGYPWHSYFHRHVLGANCVGYKENNSKGITVRAKKNQNDKTKRS